MAGNIVSQDYELVWRGDAGGACKMIRHVLMHALD